MKGWTGRILEIDMTALSSKTIELDESIYHKYIGGRGLGGYFLKESAQADAKSPESIIAIMTGPMSNTNAPMCDMAHFVAKSPLSNSVGDFSAGGRLGREIKRAGFDGIIIRGKSDKPKRISISDSKVEFLDADDILGLRTGEALKKIPSDCSSILTPYSAERGVLFSTPVIDGAVTGRGGLAINLWSKGVKLITVKGSAQTRVIESEAFAKSAADIERLFNASPALRGELGIANFGSAALFDLINSRRILPVENFRQTFFEESNNLNSYTLKKRYGYSSSSCSGCSIGCAKVADDGFPLPGFEGLASFTSTIGNSNIKIAVEAFRLCNEYGLDPISAAGTIAAFYEIFEIKYENEDILKLLEFIAKAEDEGEEMRFGSHRYSIKMGRRNLSMTVKGLDIPPVDPRGAYGLALSYATSNRGACHLSAYPISHEILRKPAATDRFSFDGKARIIKLAEDANALADSLGICKYALLSASFEEYSILFREITGASIPAAELMRTGERVFYNERVINSQNGFTSEDDLLPERFYTEDGSSGNGIAIQKIDKAEFNKAIQRYYSVRGLTEYGMPKEEKIEELGL